jgi:hypothetical protein
MVIRIRIWSQQLSGSTDLSELRSNYPNEPAPMYIGVLLYGSKCGGKLCAVFLSGLDTKDGVNIVINNDV